MMVRVNDGTVITSRVLPHDGIVAPSDQVANLEAIPERESASIVS